MYVYCGDSYWLGFNNTFAGIGDFLWVNGNQPVSLKWGKGYPICTGSNTSCGAVNGWWSAKMYNDDCSSSYYFLCQMRYGNNLLQLHSTTQCNAQKCNKCTTIQCNATQAVQVLSFKMAMTAGLEMVLVVTVAIAKAMKLALDQQAL